MIDNDILQGNDFLKHIEVEDVNTARDFMKQHRDSVEEVNRDDFIYYTQTGTMTIMVTFNDSQRLTTTSRHSMFYRLHESFMDLSRNARMVVVGIVLGKSVNTIMPVFPRNLEVATQARGPLHDR